MKKGSECLVCKYVYRPSSSRGGFWCKHKFTNDFSSLSSDFPSAAYLSQFSDRFKLTYTIQKDETTIWKDKHGNIIVRILRKNIIQTKIVF